MFVDISFISHKLLFIIAFLYGWCEQRGIDPALTSIVRTHAANEALGSISVTHTEGRAFDLSIRYEHGWTPLLINDFKREVEERFWKYGAITLDGSRKVLVDHNNGNGRHLHIQVSR